LTKSGKRVEESFILEANAIKAPALEHWQEEDMICKTLTRYQLMVILKLELTFSMEQLQT
jgi:hypothetical protein